MNDAGDRSARSARSLLIGRIFDEARSRGWSCRLSEDAATVFVTGPGIHAEVQTDDFEIDFDGTFLLIRANGAMVSRVRSCDEMKALPLSAPWHEHTSGGQHICDRSG